MTLREANDILQNRKSHWSHEIDDAKDYCIKAIGYLINAADSRGDDEAEAMIDYLDRRIAATDPSKIVVCGNCKNFDPIGNCQCDSGLNRFPQPLEDATECKWFEPYKEGI